MKLAVIVDNMRVAFWQAEALRALKGCTEIIFYNCTNTRGGPRKASHAFYYLLNLAAVRNRYTKSVSLPRVPGVRVTTFDFCSEQEGIWQRLPAALLDRIAADQPVAILKFGMTLLRVPDADMLACPILSFHHGDPDHFRGRPAGFYEILEDRPAMGQIVQILSNRLDGGQVVAFAETKVHRHSYRGTLEEAFRHSKLLVNIAIANALSGARIQKLSNGPVYRLPDNLAVFGFWCRQLVRCFSRLFYGAFVEKAWRVSLATVAPSPSL